MGNLRGNVAKDIAELQDNGFDVVCNRSRKNEYFIGSRHLELASSKLLVEVQAAKFISSKKSKKLVGKVTKLAGSYQGKELKCSLFRGR